MTWYVSWQRDICFFLLTFKVSTVQCSKLPGISRFVVVNLVSFLHCQRLICEWMYVFYTKFFFSASSHHVYFYRLLESSFLQFYLWKKFHWFFYWKQNITNRISLHCIHCALYSICSIFNAIQTFLDKAYVENQLIEKYRISTLHSTCTK